MPRGVRAEVRKGSDFGLQASGAMEIQKPGAELQASLKLPPQRRGDAEKALDGWKKS